MHFCSPFCHSLLFTLLSLPSVHPSVTPFCHSCSPFCHSLLSLPSVRHSVTAVQPSVTPFCSPFCHSCSPFCHSLLFTVLSLPSVHPSVTPVQPSVTPFCSPFCHSCSPLSLPSVHPSVTPLYSPFCHSLVFTLLSLLFNLLSLHSLMCEHAPEHSAMYIDALCVTSCSILIRTSINCFMFYFPRFHIANC